MASLVAAARLAHKARVTAALFDHGLRRLRRDRAARNGVETFLFDRAFGDCLDRLADVQRPFATALIAGCPNHYWPQQLKSFAQEVWVIDPGPLFAERAGGQCGDLELPPFEPATFDLCITVGLLDTANDLPASLAAMRFLLKPGGLLLGAVAGGHSLPRLRAAMLSAESKTGQATPRVHPRLEAAALPQLLADVGLREPVVDVDRVALSYRSLGSLVADLRKMGATNILANRSRAPILKSGLNEAAKSFLGGMSKVEESIEILHFAGWAPA